MAAMKREAQQEIDDQFDGIAASVVSGNHHRERVARQFREEQERRWAADSHHRMNKRNHNSKRGFRK